MSSRAILLAAALLGAAALPAQSQTGTLLVNVKDRQSGEALSGAQVAVQGPRQTGNLTNEQGRVLLQNLPAGSYTVTVTFLGYNEDRRPDVAVRAGETTVVELGLETAVLSLQEVVVSGVIDPTAGVKLPFTVSRVGTEQLQVPTVNSALASIQGKVAGVNIQRASGQPGAGVNIVLRSPTSFEGSNSPLIVVDGVVIARDLDRTTADIEALDIVDVEIIKGAAAASLYGSRAAAGVISITTDRGRQNPQNQTRIASRTEIGKDFLAGRQPITSTHHYLMNESGTSLVNADGRDTTWAGRTARSYTTHGGTARMMDQPYPGQVYDNLKAVYNPGQYLNQNFTVSQNTENTTFLVGLTRLDQAGALAGNKGFWRNTGRVSLDHRLGQKVSFSFTGSHARQWRDEISGNPYTAVLTYPVYVDLSRKDADGNYLMLPDPTVEIENPIWRQSSRDNYSARTTTMGSLNARYAFLPWLTFDAQLSYDHRDGKEQIYVPKGVESVGSDEGATGRLYLFHQENDAYNGAFGATVLRRFGELNTRLALRGTFEREKRESFDADGRDFIVSGIRDLTNARTLFNMQSGTTDVRANGMFADLGLDFKDRYIGSFLIRRDGSSLFGPLERWHTYRRASAAYLISREEWFNVPFINELKFRYAMGEAGGRPGFSWQYETWNLNRATGGVSKNTAGNPALKPEFTREHDWGVDVIAFGNRMQLELVYARQMTRDNIIILPATVISGYNSFRANAAKMEGRTYEATLTAYPIRRRNVTWSVNAVADNSVNTLVEWGRACFWGSNANRTHEFTCAGERAGTFYVQPFAKTQDDLPSWLQDRRDEFVVNDEGFLVWVGKRADGTPNSWGDGIRTSGQNEFCDGSRAISAVTGGCGWGSLFSANGFTYRWGEPFRMWDEEADQPLRIKGGYSLPDVNFGFGSNLRYRGFSTYLGFRGQLGGKVYNDVKQWSYNNLRHGDYDQSGKPDENKKPLDYYQRALYNGNNWTEYFLEDATFLKLGEARVSYRFQQAQTRRLLGSMAPNQLTIGANARNLFTWTKYSGFDPERGTPLSRVEGIGYPHLRNFTMTMDIVF